MPQVENIHSYHNRSKKVAVIGSGISGISAAWFLSQHHEVTLFEKDGRFGGHTNTVKIDVDDQYQSVDTGFIVFNRPNYPHLTAMLKHLKVATENTDMSFSVTMDGGALEYAGSNLNTLFAQRSNLLSPSYLWMVKEILRFNKIAKQTLQGSSAVNDEMSLGEFLELHRFSERMINQYLLPMAAAIWSCPVDTMMKFPALSFIQFFENHGLLNVQDRPQWETVSGGAKHYIDEIMRIADFESHCNVQIESVSALGKGVELSFKGGSSQLFDEVVFACHPNQAFELMDDKFKAQYQTMSKFEYQTNIAYLHHDTDLMPKRRLAWSSWNYLRDTSRPESSVAVTYWMNKLQNIAVDKPILVTLNPVEPPKPNKVWSKFVYEHPVFDKNAQEAVAFLKQQQGKQNLWFCGAYLGYGFHEDGLRSSVDLARSWGILLPWQQPLVTEMPSSDRRVS